MCLYLHLNGPGAGHHLVDLAHCNVEKSLCFSAKKQHIIFTQMTLLLQK